MRTEPLGLLWQSTCTCNLRQHIHLTKNVFSPNGRRRCTGRRQLLLQSAAYPTKLGETVVKRWQEGLAGVRIAFCPKGGRFFPRARTTKRRAPVTAACHVQAGTATKPPRLGAVARRLLGPKARRAVPRRSASLVSGHSPNIFEDSASDSPRKVPRSGGRSASLVSGHSPNIFEG